MPFKDLRAFMSLLEKRGELKTVKKEVDRTIEITKVTDKISKSGGPATLFTNVKGFKTPVLTGIFGTLDRTYLAIESNKYDGIRKMQRGLEKPLPCKTVANGPCKEVVKVGKDVNLNEIPALWHFKKDSHFFISATNVMSKDIESGKRNNSIHRMAVIDRDKLGLWINVPMHLRIIAKQYLSQGKPCPIAVVVGADPVILLCAACKIPYDVDELEFAGGVRGEPVEMIKCETVDLDVPATAELVIEGEIMPGDEDGYVGKAEYVDEAPFGEITGYYGPQRHSPLVRVKAITHRKDFIYHGLGTAVPPSEHQVMSCFYKQADAYSLARLVVPEQNIKAINAPIGHCGHTVYISIKKTHPGQAKQLIYAIFTHSVLKRVVVVDEDIDVFNQIEMDWAVSMRSRAEDYILTPEMAGQALDPMVTLPNLITKVGIDATLPLGGDKKGRMDVLRDLGPAAYTDLDEVNLADYSL